MQATGDKTELREIEGGYNDALPNMREITEGEFAQHAFFTYDFRWHGYKQILPEKLTAIGITPPGGDRPHMMPVKWFALYDKTGVAMHNDWWGKKVRYFSFAVCVHDFTEKGIGHCLTLYTCQKCGFKKQVDSSG